MVKRNEEIKVYIFCLILGLVIGFLISNYDSQEAVKRYIQEQEGKDVFEYSVFGSPNQKIGQFASQKKLGDFNA